MIAYRCYDFWSGFKHFYQSDDCPETLSMEDAMKLWLEKHSNETLLRIRDAHYMMYALLDKAVNER